MFVDADSDPVASLSTGARALLGGRVMH